MAEEEEVEVDPFDEYSDASEETDAFANAGIICIDKACSEIYPDQPNPLQVTAMLKYWLGGPDPLDYISMYENCGEPEIGIPSHWHYVSYGFSDLHGDGRVHSFTGPGNPSGFGFELTFRLVKDVSDTVPPMWPTSLMNKLAKYVFHTGNVLYVGDHIPWHKSLDGGEESQIQHMLVTKDPQLSIIDTPYGFHEFRQIVGVTEDEVKTAQKWKGVGVLELMAGVREVGPYFITDMSREKSIFQIEPGLQGEVMEGIDRDGSNLGHVTAICSWQAYSELEHDNLMKCGKHDFSNINSNSVDENECEEAHSIQTLEGVQLWFDAEAAELLPMVVKEDYRLAVRNRTDIEFICLICRDTQTHNQQDRPADCSFVVTQLTEQSSSQNQSDIANFNLQTTLVESFTAASNPIAHSTANSSSLSEQILQEPADLPRTSDDPPPSSFTVPVRHEEDSIAEQSLPASLPAETQMTNEYEIVTTSSIRGADKLFDKLGYSQTRKRQNKRTTVWRCSVRNNTAGVCPATVTQCGDIFTQGSRSHTHAANPGAGMAATVARDVKKTAKENVHLSAREIVDDVLLKEVGSQPITAIQNPSYIARNANYLRQTLRPVDPNNLNFELQLQHIPINFFRKDIKVDNRRHIIFATDAQLHLLKNAKRWYIDSTFKETLLCKYGYHWNRQSQLVQMIKIFARYLNRARLKKGRFFVFHNAKGYAVHFFPPEFEQLEEGTVDDVEPLKAKGSQLKIFCTSELIEHMSHEFESLQPENMGCQSYPQEFRFSNPRIIITVSPKGEDYSTANL